MLHTYTGAVRVLDEDGTLLVDGNAILVAGESQSTLPSWAGRAIHGRPTWKGTIVAPGVNWTEWVEQRRHVLIELPRQPPARCVLAYASRSYPDEVYVYGGSPAPFPGGSTVA